MNSFGPPVTEFLFQSPPAKLEPRVVHKRAQGVGAGGPQHHGRGIREPAEALLAGLLIVFLPLEFRFEFGDSFPQPDGIVNLAEEPHMGRSDPQLEWL
jgi:hypothetical protein